MKLSLMSVLVFSTVLSGCLIGPNYKRPTVSAPATFRGQPTAEQNSFADQGWWDVYSDPFLNALIKEALKNNYDLKTAIARAKEAEAYRGVARSAYFRFVGPHPEVERGGQCGVSRHGTRPPWIDAHANYRGRAGLPGIGGVGRATGRSPSQPGRFRGHTQVVQ